MDKVKVDSVANKVSLNILWKRVMECGSALRSNGSSEYYENLLNAYVEYVLAGGKRYFTDFDELVKNFGSL